MMLIHRGTKYIPTPEEIYSRKSNWRQLVQIIFQSHNSMCCDIVAIIVLFDKKNCASKCTGLAACLRNPIGIINACVCTSCPPPQVKKGYVRPWTGDAHDLLGHTSC